jgi:hypothetical protein
VSSVFFFFHSSIIPLFLLSGYNVSMPEPESPISLTSVHLFADLCEEMLRQGKRVRFHAPGRSMYPTIKENEVITVEPIEPSSITVGDIILYRQDRSVVAHRVVRTTPIETETPPPCMIESHHSSLVTRHSFLLRDDTWGKEDVPVTGEQILGKVVSVERNGRESDPYGRKVRLRLLIHTVGSRLKRLF